MLGSSIILVLSTCAFALNAPYPSGYSSSKIYPARYSSLKTPYVINNGTQTSSSVKPGPTGTPSGCAPYWLEDIKHQGLASFNPNVTAYNIFRNVKDFGAKGDGLTDDTAAIQRAITEGNRCTPGFCESTTTTPAIVYFPGGTYIISASIIDYYYTQVYQTTHLRNGPLLNITDHRQSQLSSGHPGVS
jgi:glucan 1,3-beta-glucosidase